MYFMGAKIQVTFLLSIVLVYFAGEDIRGIKIMGFTAVSPFKYLIAFTVLKKENTKKTI